MSSNGEAQGGSNGRARGGSNGKAGNGDARNSNARNSNARNGNKAETRRVSAAVAARQARKEFSELTQTPVERVTAVQRNDTGWLVTLEGLEMRRIPESMDVLGIYQVELSGRGRVVGWSRVGRCNRSQVEGV